jgi:putative acetyltransferase
MEHKLSAVREETDADVAAVRTVHDCAFGRDNEGRLVDRLRSDGLIVASVVGVRMGSIVANAVFSEVLVAGASEPIRAVALAPVGVTPAYQGSGFGSSVIRFGLQLCLERGYDVVFVLGDPAYYTRFGFSSEIATKVRSPYSSAGPAWMALQLRGSSIRRNEVLVRYPDAFSTV